MSKNLFTLPGAILLLVIVVFHAAMGHSALDIHVHDTYYVFSSDTWFGTPLLLGLDGLLIISWLFHAILKTLQALSNRLRWIHVAITFVCLILFICYPNWAIPRPRRYLSFDEIDHYYQDYLLAAFSILGLIITQLLFWIIAIICLIVNRHPKQQQLL